jgi:alkyldihydroxyacetonephosphate synthase
VEERRFFAEDALGGRRGTPANAVLPIAIVRPADAHGVAKALALASAAGVAIVPYGSGTGLMGGVRSLRAGIVLDTNRLTSIDVHARDRFAWAGAGVVLKDLDEILSHHGLSVGHDPWTFPVATVGGALSTNGLGYKGGRYGGIGDQTLALEIALADGSLFRTRAVSRHSAGPRIERLFIGAEGTLGVITAAALRAFPVTESRVLRAYEFETFEAGFRAIDAIAALGMRPSLLDYGEEHASPWPELAQREEEPPTLYLGFEGFAEEVSASWMRAAAIVSEGGGRELNEGEARQFWDERHVVAERFSRQRRERRGNWGNDMARDYIHVALPPSKVLAFRERCHEETARAGVGLLECGLWTGPELFSAQLAMPVALGGQDTLPAVIDTLLAQAQDYGGSMEYVHGAGLRLAHLMAREHGAGFEVMKRLKAALDPRGVLNPGKLGL